jgi:outer membrane immunogenic protein
MGIFMFKSFFLASAALLAATPAMAADFAGPRAEARLGWDRTAIDLSFDDGTTSFDGKGHDDGFGLGAEVGYDAALGAGKAIIGAYAGAEWATTKECSEVFGDDEACLKLGRNFTLGARIGAVVTPQALIYVKGGYSNGQLKATYEDFGDSDFNTSEKANRGGFHLGLGGEYNVSETGYVKAEVVRTNYNDADSSDEFVDAKIDARRTQAVVGFGLRF